MTLQEFVNSLSPDTFKELMAVCIQRVEQNTTETTSNAKTREEEVLDEVRDSIAAVKKRIGNGLVNAKRLFDVINDEIKERTKK